MKESIAVKGEPVPNPMLGCGMILFLIGVVAMIVISISGYLLFKVNIMLLILLHSILAIVVGIILIVLCLKAENHGKVWAHKRHLVLIKCINQDNCLQ